MPDARSPIDRPPPIALGRGAAPPRDASASDLVVEHVRRLAGAHGIAAGADGDVAGLLTAVAQGEPPPLAAFAVVAEILFTILTADDALLRADKERGA